ncbi:MAG: preprotein translocase subunit SecG [Clostridia bacterium]|nr:preprotein translocase subunit SecG [Clostridia bacterium]
MTTLELVLGIILLVAALFLVIAVLMQHGKQKGLSGTIAGGAETFFGKQKGKTIDKILSKATTIVAICFVVIVVAMYAIQPDINFNATVPDIGLDGGAEGYEGVVVTTEATAETTVAPVETTEAAE